MARPAAWATHAWIVAHRQLKNRALEALELPPPPDLPGYAGRGVHAVLRRTRATCLERALVRQPWLAGQGVARDLVIGAAPGPPIAAHAWLEGDPAATWRATRS